MTETLAALGGLPGLAALLTSIGTLLASLKALHNTKQLKPNHGSSFYDLVARNSVKIDKIATELDRLKERDEQEFTRLWRAVGRKRHHRRKR